MSVTEFLSLSAESKRNAYINCCGSSTWVNMMMKLQIIADLETMLLYAESAWNACTEPDWLEAFSHHPRIGDLSDLREKFLSTAAWATQEQAGTQRASDDMLAELADLNRAYEDKFGFIFIVCATGKSAEEMLEILMSRLPNATEVEIQVAAQEQLKITKLRLEKLFTS